MDTVKFLKQSIKAYGQTRYWCNYCGCHVIYGHFEDCKIVKGATELFGKAWVSKNIKIGTRNE